MVEKKVIVDSESGIHARSAASIVSYVRNYNGIIEIYCNEKKGNLKCILSILSLGIRPGATLTFRIEGENEEPFSNELIQFIANLKS